MIPDPTYAHRLLLWLVENHEAAHRPETTHTLCLDV